MIKLKSTLALAFAGALVGLPLFAGSCTSDPTNASVRSLERAGKVALVCFGKPGEERVLRPLSDCNNQRRETNDDFGDGTATHLYALITLETRGEVAVVDLTSKESNVLDQDTTTPGETSLPVGAQPVDIVATPKGTAAFVASADVARPGLYALPAELLRPCESDSSRCDAPPATIASWPACALPSLPGSMVMVADPADADGNVRQSCDSGYEAAEAGTIDAEGLGRQKLYVTLPRDGQIVVIDAQSVLESPSSTFYLCPIERTIDLSGDVASVEQDVIEEQPGCAVPEPVAPRPAGAYTATPAGLALVQPVGGSPGASGARLYVADLTAPKIHGLDLDDPCEPSEDDALSLLPTSSDDPTRVVFTDRIAVSGVTPSEKRHLYAIDFMDKSVMAFDVSDGVTAPQPLRAANAELNPFQPDDRVRFAAAPVDVMILERDDPESSGTQVTPLGTECDPRKSAVVCSSESTDCDLGTLYRPSLDFEKGAGPFTLRGVFAMVALASGELAVIDIEDFDAPCRGPKDASCGGEADDHTYSTGEPSCGVVLPHQARDGTYLLSNDDVGRHLPGIQSFPVLSLEDGTVIPEETGPSMVAVGDDGKLAVGGDVLDVTAGVASDDQGPRNTLLMNLENPRVHQADQDWAVTYQGALPGFENKVGDLRVSDGSFVDITAHFCQLGVQSEEAVRASLADDPELTPAQIDEAAVRLADRVFIAEALFESDADYWTGASCSFQDCRSAFGPLETPKSTRDLRIIEAYEDRLEVAGPPGLEAEFVECCFPTLLDYEIRPGDEWVVTGSASGFVHSTIATPESGECRPSCDPRLERRTSRVRYLPESESKEVAPFVNALFSFGIQVKGEPLQRDMAFRFRTQAAFAAIRGQLTNEDRINVQAQQIGYIQATDEIFITDGALEGVLLVPGNLVGDIRQFF